MNEGFAKKAPAEPGATLALYDVELLSRKVGICPDGRVDENLAGDDDYAGAVREACG
jgi:hypothetical protein